MNEQEGLLEGDEPRWEKCRTCHAWLTYETELDYFDCPDLNPCRGCRPWTEEPAGRGTEDPRVSCVEKGAEAKRIPEVDDLDRVDTEAERYHTERYRDPGEPDSPL